MKRWYFFCFAFGFTFTLLCCKTNKEALEDEVKGYPARIPEQIRSTYGKKRLIWPAKNLPQVVQKHLPGAVRYLNEVLEARYGVQERFSIHKGGKLPLRYINVRITVNNEHPLCKNPTAGNANLDLVGGSFVVTLCWEKILARQRLPSPSGKSWHPYTDCVLMHEIFHTDIYEHPRLGCLLMCQPQEGCTISPHTLDLWGAAVLPYLD